MSKNATDARATKSDLESSFADLKAQMRAVADEVKGLVSAGKEVSSAGVDVAAERARSVKDSAVAKERSLEARLAESVSEDPLKALAIAAGVGALAGIIFGRK